MDIFLKQKAFSWRDKFTVFDENGNDLYYVRGEVFTLGRKLHIYDLSGSEIAFVRQKVWAFMQKYYITIGGVEAAMLRQRFTLLKPEYSVEAWNGSGMDWFVRGDFWAHEYEIDSENGLIATISKRWFTWGDAYDISIANDIDPVAVLAVVIAVDACVAGNNSN